MFTVYLTNFGYYLADGQPFATFEAALAAARKACFEALIFDGDLRVASWSPIGGLRTYEPAP
jgi:hypothetical protein